MRQQCLTYLPDFLTPDKFKFGKFWGNMWDMRVEFLTSIDDYNFKNISEKILSTLKETMICTLLSEKVQVFKLKKAKDIIENQTYWSLI